MLRVQTESPVPTDLRVETPRRDVRLYVRLGAEDQMMLRRQAGVRGLCAATYVSLLVRSHLRGVTPIPKDELLAVKRAITELRALGNNLNGRLTTANLLGGQPWLSVIPADSLRHSTAETRRTCARRVFFQLRISTDRDHGDQVTFANGRGNAQDPIDQFLLIDSICKAVAQALLVLTEAGDARNDVAAVPQHGTS